MRGSKERRLGNGRRSTDLAVAAGLPPDAPRGAVSPCRCGACEECVRALRYRYGLVSRAIQQTADTVVITDRTGVIEHVNPAFEVTTGYTAAEAIGGTPRLLKSGVHDEGFYRDLWSGLLAGTPFMGEIVNRKKTGELYRAQQSITPLRDEAGEITHFVSVLKDVTELRQAQELELYMALAQEVQQRYYRPPVSPAGFELAAVAYPAHLTGGDYFDVLHHGEGSVWLVIGDVVGHGIGAALVMAALRAYVRAFVRQEAGPGETLARINDVLVGDLAPNQFVTLLLVRIDPATGAVEYASAGHTTGYVVGVDPARGSELRSTGRPLGLFPRGAYHSRTLAPMESGDTLLLVTDGLAEARSPDDQEFGTERLLGLVRRHFHESPDALIAALCGEVRRFAGGQAPQDDVTGLVCRRL